MDWLNYHHLLYFWTVAREGSVSEPAATLHVAQPTVSGQMRSLERALGQAVRAAGSSLALTPEGENVFRYADEIFSLGRDLLQAVKGDRGQAPAVSRGRVRCAAQADDHRLLEPAFAIQPAIRLTCDRQDGAAARRTRRARTRPRDHRSRR